MFKLLCAVLVGWLIIGIAAAIVYLAFTFKIIMIIVGLLILSMFAALIGIIVFIAYTNY